MIHAPRRIQQAGRNVVGFEIRIIRQNVVVRGARREQLEDINDAHAQSANARSAATLFGADRNALEEVGGDHTLKDSPKLGRGQPVDRTCEIPPCTDRGHLEVMTGLAPAFCVG